MRKILILIVLGCFSCHNIHSQTTHQDSVETYNKINKWAVVKLTTAYMEDLKGWSPHSDDNEYSKSSQSEVKTYKKLVSDFENYTTEIDFEKVAKMLTEGWGKTRDSVFKKYKKELVDSINPNSYHFQSIQFVPEKTSTTINRKKVISEINKKYNSLLPKLEKKSEIVTEKAISTQSELNTTTTADNNKLSFLNIMVYLVLVISVLLNIFFIYKNKLKNKKIEPKKGDFQDFYESENKGLKNKNKRLENEVSELKNKLSNYKECTIKNTEEKLISNVIEDIKSQPIEMNIPKVVQTSTKLIYFPSPFENNRFANEDVSETEKTSSLYVAEIDKKTNQGDISLIETADFSRALNSPNIYLEKACNYENAYYSSAKGIKVIEDGKLVLEGEDWIVTTKIRIKFI